MGAAGAEENQVMVNGSGRKVSGRHSWSGDKGQEVLKRKRVCSGGMEALEAEERGQTIGSGDKAIGKGSLVCAPWEEAGPMLQMGLGQKWQSQQGCLCRANVGVHCWGQALIQGLKGVAYPRI